MDARQHSPTRAALAARWREDAQVFRRYGSIGRARMLERLAADLEQTAAEDAGAVADLALSAELTGFTRGHLRRLYREGKLIPVGMEAGEPLFRVSDLPRKLPNSGQVRDAVQAVFGEGRVSRRFPRG